MTSINVPSGSVSHSSCSGVPFQVVRGGFTTIATGVPSPRALDRAEVMTLASAAAGRLGGRHCRSATGGLDRVLGERAQLRAVSIVRRFTAGVEGFPDDTLRVGDPALFRLGIATGRRAFFKDRPVGGSQAAIDIRQFVPTFDRDAEMLDTLVGADFVATDERTTDILLVDGSDNSGQAPQLCSLYFYRACRSRLNADGILVVNLCNHPGKNESILRRLRECFGIIIAVPAEVGMNLIVFAFKDERDRPDRNDLREVASHAHNQKGEAVTHGIA